MFAQVIQGRTKNPDSVRAMQERWDKELRPGATGWVGTTGGVAPDGTVFLVVRFESEAAAQANSDRPEQGAFFEEVKKNFEGEPTFINSTDVQTIANPSDDAGFVQAMIYTVKDRKALEALEERVMPELMKGRPDLLGAQRIWDGNTVVDVNYFSSEAEARAGEKKMEAEMGDMLQEFMSQSDSEPTFIDLPDPILRSA